MASRNTTNNAKRAARRGKKNAARRGRGTANGRPNPASVNQRQNIEDRRFQCVTCGVWSRPNDDEWRAFAIPNLTSEVRFVCPAHASAASVESVFRDLFPRGLPAANCQRCGQTRTPEAEGWSVLIDHQDRVVGHLCPMDQTHEERVTIAANSDAYVDLLAEAITTGSREHELHLLGRAEFACRAVFEERASTFLSDGLRGNQRPLTRQNLVDWAAEAVDRLAPPEDLRPDFLVAFFEQYATWLLWEQGPPVDH